MGWRQWANDPRWLHRWYSAGTGEWRRRRLHKAERAFVRGRGRERSVRHYAREVNGKNS
jgi:hypothetical protein